MDPYRTFTLLRVNELTVIRHGLFHPWYELTDGQFIYGKIKYTSWTKRGALLECFDGAWKVKPKSWLTQSLRINTVDGQSVGEVTRKWSSCAMTVKLNNQFEAKLAHEKLFSKVYALTTIRFGEIFRLKKNFFKLKRPFTVTLDRALLPSIPNLPLLILLGVQLQLLRQMEGAAAASV
jgi:hypothetical protein